MARVVYDSDSDGELPSVNELLQSCRVSLAAGRGKENTFDGTGSCGLDNSNAASKFNRTPLTEFSDDNIRHELSYPPRIADDTGADGSAPTTPQPKLCNKQKISKRISVSSDLQGDTVRSNDELDEEEDDDEDDDDICLTGRRSRNRARARQIIFEDSEDDENNEAEDDSDDGSERDRHSHVISDDEPVQHGYEDSLNSDGSVRDFIDDEDSDCDKSVENEIEVYSDNPDEVIDRSGSCEEDLEEDSFHDAVSHRLDVGDSESGDEEEESYYHSDEGSYESDFIDRDDDFSGILSYSPPSIGNIGNLSPDSSPERKEISIINLEDSPLPKTRSSSAAGTISRRRFNMNKEAWAQNYLDHMEDMVNHGKISMLTEATGGIKIIWNKRLLSTAGRASAKREGPYDGAVEDPTVLSDPENKTRYYAQIELSEKVIDTPEKIANTMAHEYAHLCVMLLQDKGNRARHQASQAHGREFYFWGNKITNIMDLEPMTRCHDYKIEFKYQWQCQRCQYIFGRQSRSIKPARHRCKCKGRLVQIKPAHRLNPDGTGQIPATPATSKYNQFVKDNFAAIKNSMGPSTAGNKVMTEIGRRWKLQQQLQGQEHKDKDKAEDTTKQKQKVVIEIIDEPSIVEL